MMTHVNYKGKHGKDFKNLSERFRRKSRSWYTLNV